MTEEKTNYPIDERCKDCSLFQVVEDIKKQIVDVALQASEVVLNREVNQDDNTRLVNDFIKDIVN